MELGGDVLYLSYQDLACYTDNFCESNFLGRFQFGKLYRGKIVHAESTRYVMVKIWEVPKRKYIYRPGDNESRLMDEVVLLRSPLVVNHPNMVNLYGYCDEIGHLGVVYDFNPFDSVYNLIPKDDFTWLQRINVIMRFASLLRFLHTVKSPSYGPLIIRNLDCAHIVLDKDYNPKLCDFGLVTGGIFPDRSIYKCHHVLGSYGYIDVKSFDEGQSTAKRDVYAFGVLLMNMISKKVETEEDWLNNAPSVSRWAWNSCYEYEQNSKTNSKKPKFSLAHQSLSEDPDFDACDMQKITAMAFDCTNDDFAIRPTMRQVISFLLNLNVVKKHAIVSM
ncbi:hypothetical protein ABFS82_14G177800 [Erythranthe guttata]